jgi:hypothetical protein
MEDQMQTSRFERKYVIRESMAPIVREYLRGFMVLDEFSETREDWTYPVHSIYLDSDQLHTYWATVQTEKTRFKLRVRYYDENPESPVFFEVKSRVGECIFKKRGAVRRWAVEELLAGQYPEPRHMVSGNPKHLVAVQTFCHLMQRIQASPKVHVGYDREAWLSPGNNSLRITFDKYIRGEERTAPHFILSMSDPVAPFIDRWVLEVKYTNRFPNWLSEMTRNLELFQSGASKYCGSITNIAENSLGRFRGVTVGGRVSEILKMF